jgi:hypothetical protein
VRVSAHTLVLACKFGISQEEDACANQILILNQILRAATKSDIKTT